MDSFIPMSLLLVAYIQDIHCNHSQDYSKFDLQHRRNDNGTYSNYVFV